HTRCLSDWSSDVCSSDLAVADFPQEHKVADDLREAGNDLVGARPEELDEQVGAEAELEAQRRRRVRGDTGVEADLAQLGKAEFRSEERRVGKEGREWWWG